MSANYNTNNNNTEFNNTNPILSRMRRGWDMKHIWMNRFKKLGIDRGAEN